MQRAFKRQKSNVAQAAANGELPYVGSPEGANNITQQPPGADFLTKCWEVFQRVVADIPPRESFYGVSAKEVWFKSVRETFPGVAEQYYRVIHQPRTLGDIQKRLKQGRYASPQDFAEVGRVAGVTWGPAGASGSRRGTCVVVGACCQARGWPSLARGCSRAALWATAGWHCST